MAKALGSSSFALAVLLAVGSAFAAKNDAAATKLRDEAIYTDFLGTHYPQAEAKLVQALALCGGDDCSPKVRARLHCDLGVVLVAQNKLKEARTEFDKALAADPKVKIDKDLITGPVVKLFEEARDDAEAAAAVVPKAAEGTVKHTPPTGQAMLTPVPLYVELPADVTAAKVYARYKPFGATSWKTAQMHKVGKGWGVELPCLDSGTMAGNLEYFVLATDAAGDVVATTGSAGAPHRVPISAKLEGQAPHLPGEPPPSACADPSDCPPGFPGCKAVKGASGAACDSDAECAKGYVCNASLCEAGAAAPKVSDAKKNWVGLAFQQDMLFVPSAVDACNGGNGYSCFDGDTYYDGIPLANADNQVNGGLGMGTRRVLVGYDRALHTNITVGARLGFAFGSGPTRPSASGFMPLHLEARGAYWFGSAPLATSGFHPYVLASFGIAQVDAKVPVSIYADRAAYTARAGQDLAAWRKSGTGFLSAGLGAMIAFAEGSGLLIEAKALQMLVTPATGLAVQVGYVIGL